VIKDSASFKTFVDLQFLLIHDFRVSQNRLGFFQTFVDLQFSLLHDSRVSNSKIFTHLQPLVESFQEDWDRI
jgi:hypothetical protein